MSKPTNAPKNIVAMKKEILAKRVNECLTFKKEILKNVENFHVRINCNGNIKTGISVPTVSLIPVADCGNCSQCSHLCYDVRNDIFHKGVSYSRAINSAIYEADPDRYFSEISDTVRRKKRRYFRWHVGGDIKHRRYLEGMVKVATENPDVTFLAFSKMYGLINDWVSENGEFPANFRLVFSAWPGMEMENPNDFPTSNPWFADGTNTTIYGRKYIYCPGNCSECAMDNNGCFGLRKGEGVIFFAH